MTSSEDLQKTQIVLCLKCPTRHSIDGITGQLFGIESTLTWKGYSLSGDLVADPIADPIGITSPLRTVSFASDLVCKNRRENSPQQF